MNTDNDDLYIESVKKVRDCIANEENAYSIQYVDWKDITRHPEDSHQGECGTPACILGWARHIGVQKELDDFLDLHHIKEDEVYGPYTYDSDDNYRTYVNDAEWFTRKRTVAMLDNLIVNKEFDWLSLEKKENSK